ncbi:MAG TPA: hypothetical protein VM580_29865 [Labilithrix sp.]|nr:hypothetical protein [Labilithrix sp.]
MSCNRGAVPTLPSRRSPWSSAVRALTLCTVSLVVLLAACSSDDDDKDPATACKDMCSAVGFSGSRIDNQPHELNCFCTGSGTVTPAACTDMCKSTGKAKGEPFGSGQSGPNACQCT